MVFQLNGILSIGLIMELLREQLHRSLLFLAASARITHNAASSHSGCAIQSGNLSGSQIVFCNWFLWTASPNAQPRMARCRCTGCVKFRFCRIHQKASKASNTSALPRITTLRYVLKGMQPCNVHGLKRQPGEKMCSVAPSSTIFQTSDQPKSVAWHGTTTWGATQRYSVVISMSRWVVQSCEGPCLLQEMLQICVSKVDFCLSMRFSANAFFGAEK